MSYESAYSKFPTQAKCVVRYSAAWFDDTRSAHQCGGLIVAPKHSTSIPVIEHNCKYIAGHAAAVSRHAMLLSMPSGENAILLATSGVSS
jgi:hypothetical protein